MTSARAIGTGFEYRVGGWFQKRTNWQARKNTFSGANALYEEEVGKYDVRAFGVGPLRRIFLQIECKQTTNQVEHSIQKAWFDKLSFENDEYTVFSYKNHRVNYTALPESVYRKLFQCPEGALWLGKEQLQSKGEGSFSVKKALLIANEYLLFRFKGCDELYIIFDFEKLIEQIEKRGYVKELFDKMTMLEKLKIVNEPEDLTQFYIENEKLMTPREKRVYWQKVERIMNESHDKDVYEILEATYGWISHTIECPSCKTKQRTMRI
jgi:hypothetical protein